MNRQRKVINIVKHIRTGALIPVLVRRVSKANVIEEYSEHTEGRKGFTVAMLQDRWDKCKEDVIEILEDYQVPAYVIHHDVKTLPEDKRPIDVAIFFEEYIIAIERQTKFPHTKLKSRAIDKLTNT